MREANSHFDFDLDLAAEESSKNPVYYVQYAHARICSILKNLSAEGITAKSAAECNFDLLQKPEEIELIRYLATLPNEIIDAAKNYDPSKMTKYAIEAATLFHKFYNAWPRARRRGSFDASQTFALHCYQNSAEKCAFDSENQRPRIYVIQASVRRC